MSAIVATIQNPPILLILSSANAASNPNPKLNLISSILLAYTKVSHTKILPVGTSKWGLGLPTQIRKLQLEKYSPFWFCNALNEFLMLLYGLGVSHYCAFGIHSCSFTITLFSKVVRLEFLPQFVFPKKKFKRLIYL